MKIWGTLDEADTTFWTFTRHQAGDYYSHVGVFLGNTHYSRNGPMPMLHWIDDRTPPRLVAANSPNGGLWTGNEHDMYPTVDQVQIDLRTDAAAWERREAVLEVSLQDSMPNLDRLLVRIDHEPWRETGPRFEWVMKPGKNEIMAKGVNGFGREGHVSRILLRFHP